MKEKKKVKSKVEQEKNKDNRNINKGRKYRNKREMKIEYRREEKKRGEKGGKDKESWDYKPGLLPVNIKTTRIEPLMVAPEVSSYSTDSTMRHV